jgi:hypothetical protein
MTKWELFKWGAKNHPGGILYAGLIPAFFIAGLSNASLRDGMMGGAIASGWLVVLFITTSISIGKANIHLVKEDKIQSELNNYKE